MTNMTARVEAFSSQAMIAAVDMMLRRVGLDRAKNLSATLTENLRAEAKRELHAALDGDLVPSPANVAARAVDATISGEAK